MFDPRLKYCLIMAFAAYPAVMYQSYVLVIIQAGVCLPHWLWENPADAAMHFFYYTIKIVNAVVFFLKFDMA